MRVFVFRDIEQYAIKLFTYGFTIYLINKRIQLYIYIYIDNFYFQILLNVKLR